MIFVIRRFRNKDIGSGNFEERDESERDLVLSSIIAVLWDCLERRCRKALCLVVVVNGDSTAKGWLLLLQH